MNILGWHKRQEFVNMEAKALLRKSKSLAETEVKMLDEQGRKYSLKSWTDKLHARRRQLDVKLYTKIKRALQLKNSGKVYSSEREVASTFKVSEATVSVIRRAASFQQYRQLRSAINRPGNRKP